jgi:monoamine oxidase
MECTDYIVVGAGLAGLVAARELLSCGRSVILLEAQARVGGRCLSVLNPTSGVVEDLGAEWVQPAVHPLVLAELQRYNLSLEDGSESPELSMPDAAAVSPSHPDFAPLLRAISEDCQRLPLDALFSPDLAPLDVSWAAYLRAAEPRLPLVQQVEGWSFPFSGTMAEDISALAMLREARQFGGALAMLTQPEARVQGGVQGLADAIRAQLPEGVLRLGCAVQSVLEGGGGDCKGAAARVEYTAAGPDKELCTLHARLGVLVALPFNVLPRVRFSPPLPAAALAAPHAGACTKTFYTPPPPPAGASACSLPALTYPGRCGVRQCTISAAAPTAAAPYTAAVSHDWVRDPCASGTWMAPRPGQLAALQALRDRGAGTGVRLIGSDLSVAWPGWMEGAIFAGLHNPFLQRERGQEGAEPREKECIKK